MASQEGHTDIVSLLLKVNANHNLHRDDGATPHFVASQKGHADIVSLLHVLKANANPKPTPRSWCNTTHGCMFFYSS